MSRNQLGVLVIVAIIGAIVYFGYSEDGSQSKEPVGQSVDRTTNPEVQRTFAGYDCTGDCSGHEAGFRWAEEHHITYGDDCDTAGDNSNSPSFAEGCHAYVDGDSDSTDTEDSDEN